MLTSSAEQRAVPVIEGIVIPAEHEDLIRDAWTAAEKERIRKEDAKREQAALALWRKFLMGIRIVKRIQEEYGEEHQGGLIGPSIKQPPKQRKDAPTTKAKSVASPERSKESNKQVGDSEPEEGGFFRSGEGEAHQSLEKMHEEGGGFFADGSHDNLEGDFIQETAQAAHHMGDGFMEEDTELSRTSFDSEGVYTRNGSRHVEAPHISTPAKKTRLSTNSGGTPHQNQAIASLKSASAAAVASGQSSSSFEDTTAGEEQESKYFSPKKAISIRTSRPNQARESGSDTSDLVGFDAMDVAFEVPHSARNQFGKAGVSTNDQQLPAPQKANRSPKEKAIPVLRVSNSDSKRSTPAKSTPTRQAAAKANRKLRTQSKYFLAEEERAETE